MSLDDIFPAVNPGHQPVGRKVLIQLKREREVTRGGIILPQEEREAREAVAVTAKVVARGNLAYCDADTGEFWPGGPWCEPGELSRWPKHGGDKFTVDGVQFKFFDDRDMIAKVDEAQALK